MIVLIDNYDSFTYNIYHYFGEIGAKLKVYRNDEISLDEIIDVHTKDSLRYVRGGRLYPKPLDVYYDEYYYNHYYNYDYHY